MLTAVECLNNRAKGTTFGEGRGRGKFEGESASIGREWFELKYTNVLYKLV